jgi:hypothetical protein
MNRSTWIGLGTALGVTGVAGGALFLSRRASAAALPTPQDPGIVPGPGPAPQIDLPPLPTAADVKGDLSRNWGETPFDLRALFLLIEEITRIFGAARYLAIVAKRESAFVTAAHNGNAANEQDERDDSRKPTPTTRIATRRCDTANRRPTSAAAACSGARALLPVDRRARGGSQGTAAQRPAGDRVSAPRGRLRRGRLHAADLEALPRGRRGRHQGRLGQPRAARQGPRRRPSTTRCAPASSPTPSRWASTSPTPPRSRRSSTPPRGPASPPCSRASSAPCPRSWHDHDPSLLRPGDRAGRGPRRRLQPALAPRHRRLVRHPVEGAGRAARLLPAASPRRPPPAATIRSARRRRPASPRSSDPCATLDPG